MERKVPFRKRPSEDVKSLLEGISQRTMFLLKRKGPTSFVVREDGEEAKRRVRIGAENACSCGGGGRSELCAHIVFVFVKVLGVPKGNPLVWQLSLIDRELDEALKCDMAMRRSEEAIKRASNLDPAKTVQTGKTGSKAARKPLTDEDPCPICYDGLAGDDPDRVLWCRHGCGTNIHARCLRIWFDHLVRQPVPFHPAFGYSIKASAGSSPEGERTCPMCRSEWGEFDFSALRKSKLPSTMRHPSLSGSSRQEGAHYGSVCRNCRQSPIVGTRYACAICAQYDLCPACFSVPDHTHHPFLAQETPSAVPVEVEQPEQSGGVVTNRAARHSYRTSQSPSSSSGVGSVPSRANSAGNGAPGRGPPRNFSPSLLRARGPPEMREEKITDLCAVGTGLGMATSESRQRERRGRLPGATTGVF